MWYKERLFYQIYPLGFCGAPKVNDGILSKRFGKVADWIPHMKKLGVGALYLGPVFESDAHGYDTRDYQQIDCRLGNKELFADVCRQLHKAEIKVILDGVFNHTGRGFWAFQDVLKKKENSPYKDWFYIDFNGNSNYNDGFWYEGWEGHYELVRLNLKNTEVIQHIFESIKSWIRDFHIDGLRLDVAYMLDRDFLKALRKFTNNLKEDFFLLGEMIHGDYNQIVNSEMLHSCTNYECYKGLYSSFNTSNFFEIGYSLNRQSGPDQWTLYRNLSLLTFADNHDTARLASILNKSKHLPLVYGLLFAMPGIPCIYYGSEWGLTGKKESGSDDGLRPSLPSPEWNILTDQIARYAVIYSQEPALALGSYKQIYLTNKQFVFLREYKNDRIYIGINIDDTQSTIHIKDCTADLIDLITAQTTPCSGSCSLNANSISYWKPL